MIKHLTPTSWLAIAIVALGQTAALATMVYGRVSLLKSGREIVAEVIPVDPRDLFRGDYVVLGYGFSRDAIDVPAGTVEGDTLYVTLKPAAAPDQWEVVSASTTYTQPADPAQVVLKGITGYTTIGGGDGVPVKAQMRYGIESYFVPEGTGRPLEQQVRDKKISAVLAVGKSGDVAIKALIIDGQRLAEEPPL
jgi:uncharacterized membrane-anchored protein